MILYNRREDIAGMSNSRRRVKLYVLNGERWVDHGTGYVSTMFMDHDKQTKGIVLLVRSEEDGKVLLESKIKKDTVYQKQGDSETLVVWAEAEDHLALSFQEEEGCAEIWEKICQFQRSDYFRQDGGEEVDDASFEEVQEAFEEVQDPYLSIPIELPPCELSKLDEISELFHSVFASADGREKLASAIEEECYINKLTDVFHMCEDLENADGLHTLFEIFKLLFLLEKHSLFEIMFHIENIMDIVGVLEYDPSKKEPTRHRQFLTEKVQFKEVIPIHNTDLLNKIHLTYRVQYIKDILVPVPSLFDENLSALGSFLLFSKIEIVELIQQDGRFIEELFVKLTDDEISDDKRKETLCLLRELVTFSQSLQNENRINFIKSLSTHGLLQSLDQLMNIDDMEIRAVIVDIICCIVDCNPSMVRDYLCKGGNTIDEDSMLLNMLIDMLLTSSDNGMGVILMQLIRNLLDPENMCLGTNKMEKSEFLGFFYRHCMHVLTAPIFAATSADGLNDVLTGKDDFKRATILDHIIDILTFCVEHHLHHIKNYVINKDMLRRILVLMQSKHKFLALAALKFSRRIIGIKDEFYNRYITVGKLLLPVIKAFLVNGYRYNLLNSAIIELFEFIRAENITTLCTYIVENHIDAFKDHEYVETFKGLQIKYEQEKDRTKMSNQEREEQDSAVIAGANLVPKRRDDRVLDEYEESWFENDDDEVPHTNDIEAYSTKPLSAKLKDVDLIDTLRVTRTDSPPLQNINSPPNTHRPGSPQNTLKSTILQKTLSPTNSSNIDKQEEIPRPKSPNNNSDTGKGSPPNSPGCFPLMKALPAMNNKPVMNIVINSSMHALNPNSVVGSDLPNEKMNGVSTVITEKKSNSPDPIANHEPAKPELQVSIIPTKSKPQLTSLVDYPDDDDESDSTDEEEVPSSPAKKQRIAST